MASSNAAVVEIATPAVSVRAGKPHKQYTLVIPIDLQNDRVLLGYKLRGFGQGKYIDVDEDRKLEEFTPLEHGLHLDNGFGGKVEPNETIVAAAVRELHEESGMFCKEPDMIQRGALLLETVAEDTSPILEIHVFTVDKWVGTARATDEMSPEFFSISKSLIAPPLFSAIAPPNPTTSTPAPPNPSNNPTAIQNHPDPTPAGSTPSSFLSNHTTTSPSGVVNKGSTSPEESTNTHTATTNYNISTAAANSIKLTHDLSTSSAPPPAAVAAIPYRQMWEESRIWLPLLLKIVLAEAKVEKQQEEGLGAAAAPPRRGTGTASSDLLTPISSSAATPTEKDDDDDDDDELKKQLGKLFIHYVEFGGGVEEDEESNQKGEDSVWNRISKRRLEYVDELPVEEWAKKRTFAVYQH